MYMSVRLLACLSSSVIVDVASLRFACSNATSSDFFALWRESG